MDCKFRLTSSSSCMTSSVPAVSAHTTLKSGCSSAKLLDMSASHMRSICLRRVPNILTLKHPAAVFYAAACVAVQLKALGPPELCYFPELQLDGELLEC